jgi:glycosyltransferase involved in cell wall biosynthesis
MSTQRTGGSEAAFDTVAAERYNVLRLTPHIYYPPVQDGSWPVRFDPVGGMQTQIYEQAVALARSGVSQTVLAAGMPGVPPVWRPVPGLEVVSSSLPMLPIRSRLRGTQGLNQSWAAGVVRMADRMRRAGRQFDLVHSHGSGVLWPLLVGPVVARRLGLPHVLTIHCSAGYTYHAMSRPDQLALPVARAVERWSIRRSDAVITLTAGLETRYRARKASTGRWVVAPDCVDTDRFGQLATPAAAEAFLAKFGVPRGKKLVTYVGRVAIEKGWRRFVALAGLLDPAEYHFLVVGDGNEGDRLRRLVIDNGWSDRFTVTGFVDRDDIPGAYAAASVMVMPSQHEELGSSLLEAMACGCPVIACRVGGIPQVIESGYNGVLVDPDEIDEMAAAVVGITSDPAMARRLTQNARVHVSENYRSERVIPRLVRVYRDVVDRARKESRRA